MPVYINNKKDIEGMRIAGDMAAETLVATSKILYNGISATEINDFVKEDTHKKNAICATFMYDGGNEYKKPYPSHCCISENDIVCHGVPTNRKLKDCIVNIDITTKTTDGYHGDCSATFILGNVSEELKRLVRVSKECLYIGIQEAKPGKRLGDIGAAIEEHAQKNGYSIVKAFCGHSISKEFHSDPMILHYGKRNTGMRILPGMIFTIEPILSTGEANFILDGEDGWTIRDIDNNYSAQWEHTLLITENGCEILTNRKEKLFYSIEE